MRPNIAPALVLIVFAIFSSPFLASSKNASDAYIPRLAQTQSAGKTAPIGPPTIPSAKHPITAQTSEGGMWRTDGSFSPTFMLRNVLEVAPLTVTPVLYMADGTEYDLSPVQLDPAGVAMVNVLSALSDAPPNIQGHISGFGSAGIKYQWAWPAAFGAILNRDEIRSLVFQTHLGSNAILTQAPSAAQTAQVVESTWWKAEPNVSGFLSLTNTALSPISVAFKLTDQLAKSAVVQQYDLAPHATEWIDLTRVWSRLPTASTAGGMEISYTGPMNAITTSGGLEDPVKGYSQMLHFKSPMPIDSTNPNTNGPNPRPAGSQIGVSAQPQTVTFDSTGIMIGAQEADMQFPRDTVFAPYLVLRNTTLNPMSVQLAVNLMNGTNSLDLVLSSVILNPLESRQAEMKSLLKPLRLDTFNGYINLRTTFSGGTNDLLVESGSIDPTFNYVFEVPARWEESTGSRFFNYWNTNTDTDTMLTLWNYSDAAQDAVLTFFHQEGKYEMPIHLEPHASMAMSIGKLIRSGAPDRDGKVIPTSAVQGSAKISGLKGTTDHVTIAATMATFNARTGTCYYDCQPCDALEEVDVYPSASSVNVGDHDSATAYAVYADGNPATNITDGATWDTNDHGLATVDSSGNATAISPGSVAIIAGWTDTGNGESGCTCPSGCGTVWKTGDSWVAVKPKITGSSTVWYFAGQNPSGYSTSVTLTGSGGSSFSWSVTAGSNKVNLSTSTGSQTTVTSSGSAFSSSANDITIKVTVNSVDSDPFHMTTRTPNTLVAGDINDSCDAVFGYHSDLHYVIDDQLLNALPTAVDLNENWTSAVTNDYSGTDWSRSDPSGDTSDSGAGFYDRIAGALLGSTPTAGCGSGGTTAINHWGQEWRVGSTTVGNGRRVQTEVLQKYLNFARHNSITTPAP